MKQFRYCTRISLSHSLYATISIRQKNKPISLIICNNFILIRQKNKPISLIICNNFIYTADTTQNFYIIIYILFLFFIFYIYLQRILSLDILIIILQHFGLSPNSQLLKLIILFILKYEINC